MSTSRTITALLSFPDERSRHGLIALGTGFFASLLLLTGLAATAHAQDRVYWANDGQDLANRISFAYLDETGGGNLDTDDAPGGHPRGVALDPADNKVYWTKPGPVPPDPPDAGIYFANLDGTGGGNPLIAGPPLNRPNGAAIDPVDRRIYWANEPGNTISFANLADGGGIGDLTTTENPVAPAIDPDSRKIYWANANPTNRISVANLDGTDVHFLDTGTVTPANPHGVALDPVTGRIYWANVGDPAVQDPDEGISFANANGTGGGGNLTTGTATINNPVGVAIDPYERKIYWANQIGNTISWAYLDGSGGGDLTIPPEVTRNGTRSPVLLKAPSGTPEIRGGSTPGSELTCLEHFRPDQLGSWLYQARQGPVTYSWKLNGSPISDGETVTASDEGNYTCTVTASNLAGEASLDSAAHAVSLPSQPPAPPAGGPSQPSQPPAGPPSGGGSSQPPAKPAFGSKTLVTLGVAARRISGSGPVKVVIRNGNGFQLTGRLSARASKRLSVSRSFSVRAKGKTTVTLKLSKTLKRLLKREGKLSLRLTTTVKDPAGGTRTVKKTVLLRLKRA